MVPNCNQFFSPSDNDHSLPKGTFRKVDLCLETMEMFIRYNGEIAGFPLSASGDYHCS
jgi:hypothetical protein